MSEAFFVSAFLGRRCMPGSLIVCQLGSKCSMWWSRWLWAHCMPWRRLKFLWTPNYPSDLWALCRSHWDWWVFLKKLIRGQKHDRLVSVTFNVGDRGWRFMSRLRRCQSFCVHEHFDGIVTLMWPPNFWSLLTICSVCAQVKLVQNSSHLLLGN